MQKNIVLLGCGSANLFAALFLMKKGYDPKTIYVLDSGREPKSRTNMLKGFAGAGLKSDGKFVFSLHHDPLSKHMTDEEKASYHKEIQDIMEEHLVIPETGISNPVPDSKLKYEMNRVYNEWEGSEMTLRQSTVWHIGTDNELIMAISMYDHMVSSGVNMMMRHTVTDIDFNSKTIYYKSDSGTGELQYDYLQIGVGKVGVDFADTIIKKYGVSKDHGFANVGGRFETKCSDVIQKFADDVQYDFKFYKEYNGGNVGIRTFCTCNYSSYVIEEGINGVCTYNGHAYGKNHEKENGMTNFGIMARIKDIDAQSFHQSILDVHGKKGCVVRGSKWDGVTTVKRDTTSITWDEFSDLWGRVEGGRDIVGYLKNFIGYISDIFGIDGNYSYYIPEIKMAVGVIDTDSGYKMADGRYPDVTWVGDSCTGSVGIVPAAMTGMRGVERLITK